MNYLVANPIAGIALCLWISTTALLWLYIYVSRRQQRSFEQKALRKIVRLEALLVERLPDKKEEKAGPVPSAACTAVATPARAELAAPATPTVPVAPQNSKATEWNRRARILEHARRGEQPDRISELLGIPLPAVRLVLEVDSMVWNQACAGGDLR